MKGKAAMKKQSSFQKLLLLVAFGVLLNFALGHLPMIGKALGWLFSIVSPFLFGAVAAFILNVPLRAVERTLFPEKKPSVIENVLVKEQELEGKVLSSLPQTVKKAGASGRKPSDAARSTARFKRPVSLAVTVLLVLAVIAFVFGMVIPELARTGAVLAGELPGYIDTAQKWVSDKLADYPSVAESVAKLELDWNDIGQKAASFIKESGLLKNLYGTASSLVGGIANAAIGLVFSFYILMQKESLGKQVRMVLDAFFPKKVSDEVVRIASLTSGVFSRFLSGQCTEAAILGTMFVLAMSVLRFPYALLCGVLIGFTALIPIFGAFIGCFVGAFLILMTAPEKTVWFVILFLVLQQIEGQFIYPHVVGNAVGLPPIWVLVAVTVGGSLFGIFGMLFFIPLASVLYALAREGVYRKLRGKE